jgi:type VI secretion system protein ImpA
MSSAGEVPGTAAGGVVDLGSLLAPIPGENPSGESLRYAGLHDEIREARRSDEALDQGEWKRELKAADWGEVEGLATAALAGRTKDLQVCAWLAEALVKRHGLAGLRDGLRLARGLLENFWDGLYPEADEGDLDARANSLTWMDRQLAQALREVPLTAGSQGAGYSFWQWKDSTQFDVPENLEALDSEEQTRAAELQARASAEGKVTSEQWRKEKNTTRRAFYEEAYALLGECREEFKALDLVMDERFGSQTPGLGELKKALDEVHTLVEKLVKEKRIAEPDPAEAAAEESADAAGGDGAAGPVGAVGAPGAGAGPLRTRQDALRRLAEVAEFFRRTEPHSPVSYLVQRAIHWGQMPLETWLAEVVKDEGVLGHVRETLGLGADGGEG